MYINIKSLWCTPETSRILYVNYTFKKKKEKLLAISVGMNRVILSLIEHLFACVTSI